MLWFLLALSLIKVFEPPPNERQEFNRSAKIGTKSRVTILFTELRFIGLKVRFSASSRRALEGAESFLAIQNLQLYYIPFPRPFGNEEELYP